MKACVDANFDGRRAIWGDDALGGETGPNLRMISIARKYGMAAKFCGSGGAVVIVPGFSYKEETIETMRKEMEQNGFVLEKVHVREWGVCCKQSHYTYSSFTRLSSISSGSPLIASPPWTK